MTRSLFRRLAAISTLGLAGLVVHACKDSTGPDGTGHFVDLTVSPVIPSAAAATASKAHAVVTREDGSVALDTVVNLANTFTAQPTLAAAVAAAPGQPVFQLHVELTDDDGENFTITLEILDANGNVVFTSQPVQVHASLGSPPPTIDIPAQYVGPGASAVSITVTPGTATVNAGGTVDLTAQAKDQSGNVVANAPIIWTSLDPAIATVPNPTSGHVVIGAARGPARIRATLLNGQSAGATITVNPVPSSISIQSGNNQNGAPGAQVQPLVVKAVATDGLGIAGIPINFAIQSGGGTLSSPQVVTDANGLASVNYTFGSTAGAVVVQATSSGMTGSPLTFNLSSAVVGGTQVVFTTQPVNTLVGTVLSPVVVEVRDQAGNRLTNFNGTINLTLIGAPAGVQLLGTTSVTATAGVAQFPNLSINGIAPTAQLVATIAGSNTTGTSSTFAVGSRPAVTLQFAGTIPSVSATVALPQIIVEAFDVLGQLVPSYNGTVTLSASGLPNGVTMSGVTTATAVNGQAVFNGISFSAQAPNIRLNATGTGIAGSFQSNQFNVTAPPIQTTGSPVTFNVQRTAASPAAAQVQLTSAGTPINSLAVGTIAYGPGATGWLAASLNTTTTPATLTVTPTSTGLPEGTFTANIPITGSGGVAITVPVTITVTPLPVTQLVVITDPAGAVSGLNFGTQPVLEARDATGTRVFGTVVAVTAGVNSGTGALSGTTTVNTSQGRATFTNLRITGTGAHVLSFTAPGPITVNSASFNVGAALSTTQAVPAVTVSSNNAITPVTPVTAAGGVGPYTFTVSPGLPAGLVINATTGQITGTPTSTLATTTFTVTVTDALGIQSSKTFTLTINLGLGTTLAVPNVNVTQNSAITAVTPVVAVGGTAPLTYAINNPLPAGLAFNTATGQITGTPTATLASTPFTVTVTDNLGATSSKTFNLTVNTALTTTQAIPTRAVTQNSAVVSFTPVTAAGGTAPVTFSVSPSLPAGLSINAATGAITGTPTGTLAATTFTVTATDAAGATSNKTFQLTVNGALTTTVAVPATTATANNALSFTPVTAAGGTAPITWAITAGGALPNGLTLNANTGQISGTPTAAFANTTFTITATDAAGATSSKTFQLAVNGPVSATTVIPTKVLTQGAAATSFTPVTGAGGTAPRTFSINPALPAGLSINASTGAITGTPTATIGNTTFTVTVTDATNATATSTFDLTVNAAPTTTVAQATIVGTINRPLTAATPVTAANGTAPFTFSATGLPAGVTINAASGQISGTPTVTLAATNITVTATDANGAASSKQFSLTVNPAVSATVAVANKTGTQGQALVAYTPVTATGGTAPLTWAITAGGALPAGLTLNAANGQISGTPTAAQANTQYTMTVTDAMGSSSTGQFNILINGPLSTTQAIAARVVTQNSAITPFTPVTVAGGTAPVTLAISPALPAGLSFNTTTGQITGTPTGTLAQTTFTVTATDNLGAQSSKTFDLTVSTALTTTQAIATKSGTVNTAIAAFTPVTSSGGSAPVTWSSSALPAGLTINTNTGAISGTPTATLATSTITVTATDAAGATSSKTFSLTINPALTTTVAQASVTGTINTAITPVIPVTASAGTTPYSFALTGALPAGLSFNTTNGQITGTPTATMATTQFTVTVTDAAGATSAKNFNLTIGNTPPGINLNVGAAATANANVGVNIAIPINVDLSNRGPDDLVAIDVTITWDVNKFNFVSSSAGNWTDINGDGPSVFTVNCGTPGQCNINGATNDITTASFLLRTITLAPIATGVTPVNATINAAGKGPASGPQPVTVTPRNLSVTINP